MDLNRALADFNLVEGLVWSAVGLGFAVQALRRRYWPHSIVAAVAYLLFGVSDFVEMHTGAWYRPWWLLVWKVAIVGVFVVVFVDHRRR